MLPWSMNHSLRSFLFSLQFGLCVNHIRKARSEKRAPEVTSNMFLVWKRIRWELMVQGVKSKQKESNVFTVTIMESFYKTIFLDRVSIHCLMYICDACTFIYYFTLRTGFYSGCSSETSYRHVTHKFAKNIQTYVNIISYCFCCSISKAKKSSFQL